MAKKDTSKTNVTARAALKAQGATCRFCGRKPEVVRQLTPSGKTQMFRKCCAAAGIAA
ncbi:MAG TPA: hypothetical protein VGS41_12930 [Chthonomonadales bacterium]|nr:hypothetical protein [Chthonomonadales bacterium]